MTLKLSAESSTSNRQIGLSDMARYCLRTKLVEKPSVCLYYKGIEGNETIPEALNVVVAFSPTDALELDEDAAERLCKRLNEDGASLLEYGFTEFEVIKKANGV